MNRAKRQELPPGWNEKKILAVIAHYNQQTEEEGAAEIETVPAATGETWMSVDVRARRARRSCHALDRRPRGKRLRRPATQPQEKVGDEEGAPVANISRRRAAAQGRLLGYLGCVRMK